MRTYSIFAFVILAGSLARAENSSDAASAVALTPAYINQVAEEARTNNAFIRAAEARASAAEANIRSVRTWRDPEFRAGGVVADEMMRSEDGDIMYGVSQELPLFGRPKAARAVANAELDEAAMEVSYAFQMLRLEIARQLFRVAVADRALELGREDLQWLETMTTAAEERYRANTGSQAAALQAQNERAKRRQQILTDERTRDQERAQLNRLINCPLTNSWPTLELPPVAAPLEFSDRLQRLVLNNEARLKVMRKQTTRAEAVVEAAKRERLPKIALSAEGRQYSGTGEFREGFFAVSVSIPWFNSRRYRGDVEREKARLEASRLAVEDYERFVVTDARRLVTAIDAARREALLYRDEIIPRSELALQSAHAALAANRGMFLELMEARRAFLEAHLGCARAVADQYSSLVELALCCGVGDLEAIEMLGNLPETPLSPAENPRP